MSGITLEVNGRPYDNFKDVTVEKSMQTLCGKFDFIATITSVKDFPIKLQDSVRVLLDLRSLR